MEQATNRAPRIRRSHQLILRLLEEFEKSDVSVLDFCQEQGINKATFHKWKSRYQFKSAKKKRTPGFARLHITASPSNTGGVLFAQVQGIMIYQPVAASYLKELL